MKKLTLALTLLLGGCATYSSSHTLSNTEAPNANMRGSAPSKTSLPTYPIEAARNGIEGYVQLIFDIDEQGRPQNIKVMKSVPEGVFDGSARRALAQWRYKPQVIDGQARVQPGQTVQLEFTLDRDDPTEVSAMEQESQTIRERPALPAGQKFQPRPPTRQQTISGQDAVDAIQNSIDWYQNQRLEMAIDVLLKAEAKGTFDSPYERVFVQRMLGMLYAEQGDMDSAISYLAQAIAPYLLADDAQALTIRLLADIQLQQEHFQAAIDSYRQWLAFTVEQNPEVLLLLTIAEKRLSR